MKKGARRPPVFPMLLGLQAPVTIVHQILPPGS